MQTVLQQLGPSILGTALNPTLTNGPTRNYADSDNDDEQDGNDDDDDDDSDGANINDANSGDVAENITIDTTFTPDEEFQKDETKNI